MLGALNNGNVFLTVLESGKSKIKGLADLVSVKGSLPGLQTATFSLFLHIVERQSTGVSSSSYKVTNPIIGAPPSLLHLNLINPQRTPPPNTIILGVRTFTHEFGGM